MLEAAMQISQGRASSAGPLFVTLPTALFMGRSTSAISWLASLGQPQLLPLQPQVQVSGSGIIGVRLWNSAANLLGSVVTMVNVSFVSD